MKESIKEKWKAVREVNRVQGKIFIRAVAMAQDKGHSYIKIEWKNNQIIFTVLDEKE